jgi:hypothetical protein
MGHYGVDKLLQDRQLMGHVAAHVLCANDLVAAWGGILYLEQHLGVHVDCISGPATDNSAGVDYVTHHFGKPAMNGRRDPLGLAGLVEANLPARQHAVEREKVVA